MLTAFFHLMAKAWGAMIAASRTSNFGLFYWSLAGAAITWLLQFTYQVWPLPPKGGLRSRLSVATKQTAKQFVFAVAVFSIALLIAWGMFAVRTVYYLRSGMRNAYVRERLSNDQLHADLNFRRHNLVTTDAAFTNVVHLLDAFAVFRSGAHGESCVVRLTAPNNSMGIASSVAQLSVATSNCPTFGPDGVGFDRDVDAYLCWRLASHRYKVIVSGFEVSVL